ncbi:sterile alpha motif domain-containing protein 3-like [Astyanax mexicanus]|uniref:Sterile alpha motif domain-containing protein 3-like n=1 Tax=Astyanax mexicanus TaxID=7994 RepID=A0A8T2MGZ1_ASTMX|nr:sterile alpha motif domain-containing protein 3-like [Astyanax mexicanus]
MFHVNAEFTRITTVPLLSTFMSNLDHYSSQLMRVFKKKGGTAGHSISLIMAAMDKNPSIEVRRECILKALCIYLNEKSDSLMKEYLDFDLASVREVEKMVLGVYIIRHEGADSTDVPEDVGIVIEGCTVLQDLGDVANGCAVLLGFIYCLNLSYPKDLRYTFEFFQKVLMELDGSKLSNKVQVLKNKLLE